LDDLAAKVGRGYLIEIEKSTGFLQPLTAKKIPLWLNLKIVFMTARP
jgi:hypothetical protein